MRVLAIDPGDRYIGVALSDPSGTIARTLTTLQHVSRPLDAAAIVRLAREHGAVRIIVGAAGEADAPAGRQMRKTLHLVQALREQTDVPLELWDEALTSLDARRLQRATGKARSRSSEHALAAAVLLQSYLDAHASSSES